jgi:hypothetical protein
MRMGIRDIPDEGYRPSDLGAPPPPADLDPSWLRNAGRDPNP